MRLRFFFFAFYFLLLSLQFLERLLAPVSSNEVVFESFDTASWYIMLPVRAALDFLAPERERVTIDVI